MDVLAKEKFLRPKLGRSMILNKSADLVRLIIAASILCNYIIPNTIWGRVSLSGLLQKTIDANSVIVGSLALIGVAFLGMILFFYGRRETLNNTNQLPLTFLFIVYLMPHLYVLLLHHPDEDLYLVCGSVVLALVVGMMSALIAGTSRRITLILCLLAFVQGIYTVFYQSHGLNVFRSGTVYRAGGTFDHPNGVYTVMLVCLPLAIIYLLETSQSFLKIFWMAACAVLFSALLLTWYRGPILAEGVALTWLCYRLFNKNKLIIICGLAAIMMFALVLHVRSNGNTNSASAQRSVDGRVKIWHQGLIIFKNNWLTGVGSGVLDIRVLTTTADPHVFHPTINIEPKNLLLLILDETGIGGGILFCICVFSIRSVLGQSRNMLTLGISAAWIALLIAGLTDTPFGIADRPYGNVLAGCLFGTVILVKRENISDAAILKQ